MYSPWLMSKSIYLPFQKVIRNEIVLLNRISGTTITVKWRGKPLFIRHRTQADIDAARTTALAELKVKS